MANLMEDNRVLLFSYSKISVAAEHRPVEIVRILRMLYNNSMPNSRHDPIYKYKHKDFSGDSFLVNAEMLLYEAFKYSYRHVAMYIALASLRNFADWATTGNARLPLIAVEADIPTVIGWTMENPILAIQDSEILFKYEEPQLNTIH